jgi:tRNA 2-selenouridine synthase
MLENALAKHQKYADVDLYIPLIKALLTDYYDPMYDYQISNKKDRIVFQGDSKAVIDFLKN